MMTQNECDNSNRARPIQWQAWAVGGAAGVLSTILSLDMDVSKWAASLTRTPGTPRTWAVIICVIVFIVALISLTKYETIHSAVIYLVHFKVCLLLGLYMPNRPLEFQIGQIAVELGLSVLSKNMTGSARELFSEQVNLPAWNFVSNTTGYYIGREFASVAT